MAISYNTGQVGSLNSGNVGTGFTITLPSGILVGDVMLLVVNMFASSPLTSPAFNVSSAAGHTWTQVGSTITSGTGASGFDEAGALFARTATSGESGDVLTITGSGTPSGTGWMAGAMAAYTGSSGIDVHNATSSTTGSNVEVEPVPTAVTNSGNEWAVYLGGIGANGSGAINGAPGSQRQAVAASGVCAVIADSNGSVGAAGTTIGGGNFTTSGNGNPGAWYETFVVGLAPAGAGGQTAALTVAQEAISAPAPSLAEQLGLAVAQEAVSARTPTTTVGPVSLALVVARETIAAHPLVVPGSTPPLAHGAGGRVSWPTHGGSVTSATYGGEVS